jgi:hypothetical protein
MKTLLMISILFSLNLMAADKTSDQLIDEAIKANRITKEIGFLYKIKMRFSPSEVPAEFQGKVAEERTHNLLMKIPSMLNDVSAPIQQELVGFMIPPIYDGSKLVPNQKFSRSKIINKDNTQPIPEPFPKADWVYLENSDIRVWWQKDEPDEDNAREILAIFPEMKEKLEKLTGKKILSDAGKHYFKDKDGNTKYWADGGNGKLDFYIGNVRGALALTVAYPGSCSESPTFIIVDDSMYGKQLKAAIAHEFMHALSFTFTHGRPCGEYQDADEGIANWAINYVYPDNNFEQDYDGLIDAPAYGLPTIDYDSWPFFLYMEKNFGEKSIIDIYENYHLLSNWDAVNLALPGGFKKQWPLFGAAQWNQIDEFDDFRDWDNWDAKPYWNRPKGNDTNYNPVEVKANAKGNFYYAKEVELRPLATDYFYFKFNDPNIKSVVLDLLPKYETSKNLRVKVFIKKAGHLWEVEDWSDKDTSTEYCKQVNDEKIEEVVIAFSNIHFPESGEEDVENPKVDWNFALQATNIACKSWKGSFKAEKKIDNSNGPLTDIGVIELSSDATFDRFIRSDGTRAHRFNVREGGNGTYTYKGTFKIDNENEKLFCTAEATGFFTIKGKTQNNGFGLNPFNASQILSRTYSGRINATPDKATVTYNCSNNSTFTRNIIFPPAWETDIDSNNFVDLEGKMIGKYSKQNQNNQLKYSWTIIPE